MSATASHRRSDSSSSNPTGQAPSARAADLSPYAKARIRFHANHLSRRAGFNRSDRDDLEQELALDLFKALRKYDPKRSGLSTFISRVINRRCLSLLREGRRRRRESASIDETCGTDIATDFRHRMTGYSPVDEVERHERAEAVRDAVAALPGRLRDIAILLMAHSQADTARVLGVSETTIDRARKQIRKHFIESGLKELLS